MKKNYAIVLAFVLPVAFIAIVALSTYLPSLFLSTNYNFIYSSCVGTNYDAALGCNRYVQSRYSVQDGRIVVNAISDSQDSDKDGIPDMNESYAVRIFLHDTNTNESREITQEDARSLSLSGLLTSPDGVTISSNYDRGGDFFFLFDGGSSYGYYLTKGKSRSRLNLINSDDRYYHMDNFHFIGWVLPGRN